MTDLGQTKRMIQEGAEIQREMMLFILRNFGEQGPKMAVVAIMSRFLGYAFGKIGDDDWAALMRASTEPCGQPNCDCHLWSGKMFAALDEFRTELRGLAKRTAPQPE